MDIKKYWDKVNALAPQLPGETVWLMSVDNDIKNTKAGAVVECVRKLAAQRIVENTHRLAKPEEVEAHLAKRGQYTDMSRKRELSRKPQTVLVVGQEQAEVLTRNATEASPAVANIKAAKEART